MKTEKSVDIIIVGGGIAGMTAAIYSARANLSTVIIEEAVCGGLVNSTYVVENFPSYVAINGMELMEKTLEQIRQLGVEVEEAIEIEKMALTQNPKRLETEDTVYIGKAVILATGRVPVPLDIETDCEQIHYCSVCDGAAYKGKKVLVVGGGNSGFDEALYLCSLGVEQITIIEMMDRFFASETTQNKVVGNDTVSARTATRIKELIGDSKLEAAVLENTQTGENKRVDIDGIFVFIGQKPNTESFADVISLDKQGYILANEHMETNVKGVFSAGDVNQKSFRQITTALADGTIAALTAERYIRS